MGIRVITLTISAIMRYQLINSINNQQHYPDGDASHTHNFISVFWPNLAKLIVQYMSCILWRTTILILICFDDQFYMAYKIRMMPNQQKIIKYQLSNFLPVTFTEMLSEMLLLFLVIDWCIVMLCQGHAYQQTVAALFLYGNGKSPQKSHKLKSPKTGFFYNSNRPPAAQEKPKHDSTVFPSSRSPRRNSNASCDSRLQILAEQFQLEIWNQLRFWSNSNRRWNLVRAVFCDCGLSSQSGMTWRNTRTGQEQSCNPRMHITVWLLSNY